MRNKHVTVDRIAQAGDYIRLVDDRKAHEVEVRVNADRWRTPRYLLFELLGGGAAHSGAWHPSPWLPKSAFHRFHASPLDQLDSRH